MTKSEMQLASYMLDMASCKFSEHICNDCLIPDSPENRILVRKIRSGGGYDYGEPEPEETSDGPKLFIEDWLLMRYLSNKLKEDANIM